jgi:membrane-bound ClpP family serine protease
MSDVDGFFVRQMIRLATAPLLERIEALEKQLATVHIHSVEDRLDHAHGRESRISARVRHLEHTLLPAPAIVEEARDERHNGRQ